METKQAAFDKNTCWNFLRFTLFPLGELNFHIIPVGSGVMREVILNNTSKCPITYEIILPQEYQLDPEALPPAAKLKDNK